MNRKLKGIITFIISFVLAYFIFGYVWHTVFVQIHWDENATVWHKLREYYVRTFYYNIIPAIIIALAPTALVAFMSGKRH